MGDMADLTGDRAFDEWNEGHSEDGELPADILAAAERVTRAYTAEAEDWNDGEFALWRKEDLVVALVELRKLVGDE